LGRTTQTVTEPGRPFKAKIELVPEIQNPMVNRWKETEVSCHRNRPGGKCIRISAELDAREFSFQAGGIPFTLSQRSESNETEVQDPKCCSDL
jgi:hypothetical protein